MWRLGRFMNHLALCAAARDNVDALVVNCEQRNSTADPRLVAELYDGFLQLQQQADSLRQARNENAAAMKVGAMDTHEPCPLLRESHVLV